MRIFAIIVGNFKIFTILLICLLTIHSGLSVDRMRRATSSEPAPKSPNSTAAGCQIPSDITIELLIKLYPVNTTLSPGSWVQDLDIILVECSNRTSISEASTLVCENGKFNSDFPTCSTYCDGSLLQGISTVYSCHRDGLFIEPSQCNRKIPPNTEIEVFCAAGYKDTSGNGRQTIRCLPNGMFDGKRQKCDAKCGLLQPSIVSLTRGGIKVDPSPAPWHVAIYKLVEGEYLLACSGSIISPSLIISAAHCFWDKYKPMPAEIYRIVAAKYTRNYNTMTDQISQMREVESIKISQSYNGANYVENQFYADIAIIKLKAPLIYNQNVSPVCLYYYQGDSRDFVGSNLIGPIAGYGRSGVLERLSMTTVSTDECRNLRNGKLLAGDKFCLRNDNLNSTLCQGASGGGFVERHNGAFYLLGIVSYTPATQQGCVTSDFVGVSNVRYMRNDLLNQLQIYMNTDMELF